MSTSMQHSWGLALVDTADGRESNESTCGEAPNHPSIIARREVIHALVRNPDVILFEALTSGHFRTGHLPRAKRFDYWETPDSIARLVPDKRMQVIFYSNHEYASNACIGALKLRALGYRNVSVYAGGKSDWEKGGLFFEMAGAEQG